MADDQVRLKLASINLSEASQGLALVNFVVTSYLGRVELEVPTEADDLHAAVEDARQQVEKFAQDLAEAASRPLFPASTNR
jgi:hypothetical protein